MAAGIEGLGAERSSIKNAPRLNPVSSPSHVLPFSASSRPTLLHVSLAFRPRYFFLCATPEGEAAIQDVFNLATGGVTFFYTDVEPLI